jgi:hypothetical protein
MQNNSSTQINFSRKLRNKKIDEAFCKGKK